MRNRMLTLLVALGLMFAATNTWAINIEMVFIDDDPGVAGHEGFNGEMSKNEISNVQYCEFLNAASVIVNGNNVYASDDIGYTEPYYDLAGPGSSILGATNGGAARINESGGSFTVDSGFENHPVTYVSWYGANAFCNYYGYRLPTEWEWQAVADYDGSYTYGCGPIINPSIANYSISTHPDGTTVVGAFGPFGYGMCDMAGNIFEWTTSVSGSYRIIRGGSWSDITSNCTVSAWVDLDPDHRWHTVGFRVCRDKIDMTWVSIDDPGVLGHEGFKGLMSKYETTNAQYCAFLNAALASGDITVSGDDVNGANGTNNGVDFVGVIYYNLVGPGFTFNGATNGGAVRINYTGSEFTVDAGFENYPVTYVSWYGAMAFCHYYNYRLPTEWEWQAIADYDGSYVYATGLTINNSIANYYNSTHPDGPAAVGSFGDPAGYGFGICDMAGNVWEWTSTISSSSRIMRGGSWGGNVTNCEVSYQNV